MILLRIFKNSRNVGVLAIFLLALALIIPEIIHPSEMKAQMGMPFYQIIFGSLHRFPLLDIFVATTLYILLSFLLVRIGIRFLLMEERSVMPALFLILTAMAVPEALHVSPHLVAAAFFLICFTIIFDLADKPAPFAVFNASLLLAVGCLFDLKLIWSMPILWITISSLRGFNWRELVHTLIAPATILLFLFTWYWGIRANGSELIKLLSDNMNFPAWDLEWTTSASIYYAFILFLILVASIHMIRRFPTRKTMVQNIYMVLFYMFIGSALYYFLVLHLHPAGLVYLAIPASFVLANFFHRKRNHWSHELALWILLFCLGYLQFTG